MWLYICVSEGFDNPPLLYPPQNQQSQRLIFRFKQPTKGAVSAGGKKKKIDQRETIFILKLRSTLRVALRGTSKATSEVGTKGIVFCLF